MSIVESVQYNRNLLSHAHSLLKRLTKRAVVASVSGSKIRLTEGNREVARLRGAPINPGDTVYLLNVTGDDRNPGWLAIGAEGGAENALEIATGRLPINLASEYGGETTAVEPALPADVPGQIGKTYTFPAGTWAVLLNIECEMSRSVTGDPAGGLGSIELQYDGAFMANANPDFKFTPVGNTRTARFAKDIVGIPAGTHTFNVRFRGTTIGSTYIFALVVSGVAYRTA